MLFKTIQHALYHTCLDLFDFLKMLWFLAKDEVPISTAGTGIEAAAAFTWELKTNTKERNVVRHAEIASCQDLKWKK